MGYPGLPLDAARAADERRRDGDGSSLDARSSAIGNWVLILTNRQRPIA